MGAGSRAKGSASGTDDDVIATFSPAAALRKGSAAPREHAALADGLARAASDSRVGFGPAHALGRAASWRPPAAGAAAAAAPSARPIIVVPRTPTISAGSDMRAAAMAAAETNLAPGWAAKWSNSRSVCYWVSADGTSVWEKPVAKLGDTLILTDLELIRSEDVKKAVTLRRAASAKSVGAVAAADADRQPLAGGAADAEAAANADLPPGWSAVWSRSRGQWYWRSTDQSHTSWTKPTAAPKASEQGVDACPAGWTQHFSRSRQTPYWTHDETGTTTWERPLT